jgi:hypothetical protein
MDRDTILKNMLTGVSNPPATDDLKKSLTTVMKAFSTGQLERMHNAGVRFWPFDKGAPPEYHLEGVPDLKAPAEYKKEFRAVRVSYASLNKGSITEYLRHELAHAWDDVRNEKNPPNLRTLTGKDLEKELERLGGDQEPFESMSTKKLKPSDISIQEMLRRYQAVVPDQDMGFPHDSTAPRHAAGNSMEFYAEGYSVFHGFTDDRKARLLRFATELYDYLEWEAKGNGLPVPDRKMLDKLFDDTYPTMKNYK